MRLFVFLIFLASCLGCAAFQSIGDNADNWSFRYTGGTVFGSPFQVTTKQLHFDTGELFGKDIVIEGRIEYFGAAFTHLLLSDKEGKILVVMTELPESYNDFVGNHPNNIRILGRLERGKKGLPYLLARSLGTDSHSAF